MTSKKKSIVDNKSIRHKPEAALKCEKCEELKKNNTTYRDCHCENCGFDLKKLKVLKEKKKGYKIDYCPSCGQYTFDVFKKKGAFWGRMGEDVYDIKQERWQTLNVLWTVIQNPSYLIKKYWNGQRKEVGSPFRLFMLVTFAFFFIVPILEAINMKKERVQSNQKVWLKDKQNEINPKHKDILEVEKKFYWSKELKPEGRNKDFKTWVKKRIKKGIESAEKKEYTTHQIIYSWLYLIVGFCIIIGAFLFWAFSYCINKISKKYPIKTLKHHLVSSIYFFCSVLTIYLLIFIFCFLLDPNSCNIFGLPEPWSFYVFFFWSYILLTRILNELYLQNHLSKNGILNLKSLVKFSCSMVIVLTFLRLFMEGLSFAEYFGYFWEGWST